MIEGAVVLFSFGGVAYAIFWLLRRWRIAAPGAAALATVVALGIVLVPLWFLIRSRDFELFGSGVFHAPTDERVVALTFDDGPTPEATREVLAMLEQHEARATFFLIGAEIERNPQTATAIIAAGHEVGNHSWSHHRMIFKSREFITEEIENTDAAIRRIGWKGPILFRSPYGKRFLLLPWYLHRTGRLNVFWDLEPESDGAIASEPRSIAAHVIERAEPGSIVLLHVMYPSRKASRDALPLILEGLRRRGFQFVTVSELLAARNQTGSPARSGNQAGIMN